jgi:FkbM family methyltransferase
MLRKVVTRAEQTLLTAILRPRGDHLVRLGSNYGGWWVPESVLRHGAVAYCAGAGEDISFDLELLAHGMKVTTFDPTPRSISYINGLAIDDAGFRFVPVGWWDAKDELQFYAPRDPSHVSHSVMNLQGTDTFFTAAVDTVAALGTAAGDEDIDLIKMDIEGAETRVIRSILRNGIKPSVLCVEFDQPQPFRGIIATVGSLRRHGYRAAKIEGWNVTFVRH